MKPAGHHMPACPGSRLAPRSLHGSPHPYFQINSYLPPNVTRFQPRGTHVGGNAISTVLGPPSHPETCGHLRGGFTFFPTPQAPILEAKPPCRLTQRIVTLVRNPLLRVTAGGESVKEKPRDSVTTKDNFIDSQEQSPSPCRLWLSLARPPAPSPAPPRWAGRPSLTTTRGGRCPHPPHWGQTSVAPRLSGGPSHGHTGPSGRTALPGACSHSLSRESAPRPGPPGAVLAGQVPCTRASDRRRPGPEGTRASTQHSGCSGSVGRDFNGLPPEDSAERDTEAAGPGAAERRRGSGPAPVLVVADDHLAVQFLLLLLERVLHLLPLQAAVPGESTAGLGAKQQPAPTLPLAGCAPPHPGCGRLSGRSRPSSTRLRKPVPRPSGQSQA